MVAVHLGVALVVAGGLTDALIGVSGFLSLPAVPGARADAVATDDGRTLRPGFEVFLAKEQSARELLFQRQDAGAASPSEARRIAPYMPARYRLWTFWMDAAGGRQDGVPEGSAGLEGAPFSLFCKYQPGKPVVFAGMWMVVVGVALVCLLGGAPEEPR